MVGDPRKALLERTKAFLEELEGVLEGGSTSLMDVDALWEEMGVPLMNDIEDLVAL